MCTQARIPSGLAAERERVVEVLRGLRVDRERRSARGGRRGRRGSARGASCGSNSTARAVLDEQRLEHVLDPPRRPEPALDPRAAAAGADDREVAGLEVADPLRLEHDRHAGREVRLADDELAAAADLDDDAGWRSGRLASDRGGSGGSSSARSRARRARGPCRAGSARSAGTRARARRGRPTGAAEDRAAARSPCRVTRKSTASSEPASPQKQALDHERAADEPVRRADELHHLDLTASREDREPDRVRDQQRRRRRAGSTVAIVKITSITCATWRIAVRDLLAVDRPCRRPAAAVRQAIAESLSTFSALFGVTSSESGAG